MGSISVDAAHRELIRATKDLQAQRYVSANSRPAELRARVQWSIPTGRMRDRTVSDSYLPEGELQSALGNSDKAFAAYGRAEALLTADDGNRERLGGCLINIAVNWLDTGLAVDVALRTAQLDALAQWRASQLVTNADRRGKAMPLIWAACMVMGFKG